MKPFKCVSIRESYHGYVKLYPATDENYIAIANAIADGLEWRNPVIFDSQKKKFKTKDGFIKYLMQRLKKEDFVYLGEDFYEFQWGEVDDFRKLPDDYYGF